ncbi:MAG TPA: hypothetical protein VH619_17390 [Verrucomicrobiae bacterium]|jgi:hypothetical protein|nr:hypothetical protein [Verrucomicrobiae bacterium]
MQFDIIHGMASAGALTVGVVIGLSFGAIQDAAARKYQLQLSRGQLNSGWGVVPGSMRRTAYFLMILAAIQVVCPLIFTNGCQWWVSGGVAAGYGFALYRQMRRRMARNRLT